MRFTNLFGKTLRDNQKDADLISHNLLLRAGYIRQLAAGIFTYLHFGQRSLRKIEQIIREEMDNIGGNEICMPIVHPAEVWQTTNRWYEIDDSMVRFKDRNERDMVLAMTHEEIVAFHTSIEIDSYKQLPKLVYQIYTKFRDEQRSRGGLIRVREFTMKDSYSLDANAEGLEKQYIHHFNAYFRIFARTGLPVIAILSDTGMMGGKLAHEYMYVTSVGEDTIFICEQSGYKANKEVATIRKNYQDKKALPLEKVYTPNKKTIADLADFLKIEAKQLAKIIFFKAVIEATETVIAAVVRGDMEANPIKIQKLCKTETLNPASEEDISGIKAVPGYASPIDIDRTKCLVIIDDLIAKVNNYVVGANEQNYHYLNACYQRDYTADIIGDIVNAFDGALCPISNSNEVILQSVRGVEVGNIFQLGTKYTKAFNATYMDVNGKPQPIWMGSYGIGVGRLLACLCEEYHDEFGLKLPIAIAPYQVVLTAILETEEVANLAEELYHTLRTERIEVIYDDRAKKVASAGVKFRDADLIGFPIRLTISKRSLKNGGVEFKVRGNKTVQIISLEEVLPVVNTTIKALQEPLNKALIEAEQWR